MHYKIKHYKLRSRRWVRRLEKRYRDHPRLIPVLAGAALVFILLILAFTLRDSAITVNKIDANIVILHVDNKTLTLPTREATVGTFLEKAGVIINEGDLVEPALDTPIVEDDFRVNVYRAAPVVIEDEGSRLTAFSAGQTPRSIADQAGLILYPEDQVSTKQPEDFLRDGIGHKIVIKRSIPINLNLYGTALALRTHAKSVGEFLSEKKISLAPDDTVQPAPETPMYDNIQIFVTRAGIQIISSEESIPMPVQTVNDPTLSFGTVVTRQRGAPGKKSVTYQLQLINGREASRQKIQEIIILEPVTQVTARGTAISIPGDKTAAMNAAGIAPSDHAYVNYIVSRESRWNVLAQNTSSGAYGLCQALPGSKMASYGSDWQTNAVTQLKWCNGYAVGRYGSWEAAYNFWLSHHWW